MLGYYLVSGDRDSEEAGTMGDESNGNAGRAAPMKFSFSKTKPSNRRPPLPPRDKPRDAVEYVTSVDGERGIVLQNGRGVSSAKVVPKLDNSWRPEKRMKNIMIEADVTKGTEETFEVETMAAGPKPDVQYGLTLMTRADVLSEDVGASAHPGRHMSLKEIEDQRLREDLSSFPEEATLEKYEELPIEEFGEALLRGMGWEKGKPIGRNSKVVIAPIEYVKRPGTLGLGAVPVPPKEAKRLIKPGETREKKSDYVALASVEVSRTELVVTERRKSEVRHEHSSKGRSDEDLSYLRLAEKNDVISRRHKDERVEKLENAREEYYDSREKQGGNDSEGDSDYKVSTKRKKDEARGDRDRDRENIRGKEKVHHLEKAKDRERASDRDRQKEKEREREKSSKSRGRDSDKGRREYTPEKHDRKSSEYRKESHSKRHRRSRSASPTNKRRRS